MTVSKEYLFHNLIQLNKIAVERGQSLAQMALAWVLRDKRVTSVLVGTSSIEQIEENIATLDNKQFTAEELERIETIVKYTF